MGIIKKISLLLAASLVVVCYNNCSQPTGLPIESTPQLSTSIVAEANGGGHPGKLSYDFFSRDPLCGTSSVLAEELTIDRSQKSAEISVCQSPASVISDYSEVFYNAYNPYLAFYQQKVFALKEFHADLVDIGRIRYNLFCYNADLKIDFTIQHFRSFQPTGGPPVTMKGIIFDASTGNDVNLIETPGSTRDPNFLGVIPFIAADGSYRFEYATPGTLASPSEGFLYYENGDTIRFQCLTNFVASDKK